MYACDVMYVGCSVGVYVTRARMLCMYALYVVYVCALCAYALSV